MSENPYEVMMPQGEFGKAVDAAIEEANARFLADPDAQQEAVESGERWRHLLEAEQTAGEHGVVLPVALAENLLRILDGEQPTLPKPLMIESLRQRVSQTHARKDG